MRRILAAAALMAATMVTTVAVADNDLREFRVGMAVGDLPNHGYQGFACAADPTRKLESWQSYGQCPADPSSGLRAVRFRYDEQANPLAKVNDLYEGTKVGGHPALLTLLIGDDQVRGLIIETDPAARLYLRKKAFLFGDQAKARYGDDGWTCANREPTADDQPVGSVFIDEHCEKTASGRHLILDRALFRRAGQDIKNFVSRSRLEILKAPG